MKAIVAFMLISGAFSTIYDPAKSAVMNLIKKNYESQIVNNREKGVSIVYFYKGSDSKSTAFKDQYETFAQENKGMYRIAAMDCDEQEAVCNKDKITTFPTFRVFPPFPAPTFDLEGDFTSEKAKKSTGQYFTNRAIELNSNNHATFITENPGKAKVILFTNKKGTPLIFKALSNHFEKTLLFGIIREEESGLTSKYKIKEFPSVVMIKNAEEKPIQHKGKMNYEEIFNFINIYSETFVFKGTEEVAESAASKPWLTEKVPQLHADSANDICLKKDGALCVIYLSKNEADKQESVADLIHQAGQQFSSKINRGINFYFMWMDCEKETAYCEVFGATEYPKIVILNPGKRKRFVLHDSELTTDSVAKTLDKILGGDAKFTPIKGNALPEFSSS